MPGSGRCPLPARSAPRFSVLQLPEAALGANSTNLSRRQELPLQLRPRPPRPPRAEPPSCDAVCETLAAAASPHALAHGPPESLRPALEALLSLPARTPATPRSAGNGPGAPPPPPFQANPRP